MCRENSQETAACGQSRDNLTKSMQEWDLTVLLVRGLETIGQGEKKMGLPFNNANTHLVYPNVIGNSYSI